VEGPFDGNLAYFYGRRTVGRSGPPPHLAAERSNVPVVLAGDQREHVAVEGTGRASLRGHGPHERAPSRSTPPIAGGAQEIALDQIEAGGNVRQLDAEHVSALAGSMALRGLSIPIAVRPRSACSGGFVARRRPCSSTGMD
jgi:hypothetical protein